MLKKDRFEPFSEDWSKLWDALKLKLKIPVPDFCKILSVHITSRLEELDETISYVKDGGYQSNENAEEYIRGTLSSRFVWTDEGKNFLRQNASGLENFSMRDCIEFVKNNWKPPYKYQDLERWKKRAILLKKEPSHLIALKKFDKILQEFEPFEEIIIEDAIAFDNWVNEQVDIMRGK